MKKYCVIVFFGLLLISAPAFPIGFGFYGTGGYGKVDMMRFIDNGNDYRVMYSIKNSVYGAGLILESGDDSKNYHNRLNAGVEGSYPMGGRYQFRRFMRAKIDNIFAFRVAGNEQVRFWLGPLIGIQLLTGHVRTTRDSEWSFYKRSNHLSLLSYAPPVYLLYGLYYMYYENLWKRKYGIFIPVGIAMGVNIRLSENAAITVEGGFRCGFYFIRNGGFNYEGYANAGFIFGAI
ncbi:MAG: hypothetical protein KA369_21060 [Spirochaetes bacterium]|nr:hypothetical protein [Spirochaetota bacterium]